jgi:dTDP-glucose 4,6-dehydratase
MKLLVTGGCGFIGSSFCRYMLGKHADLEIVNLDKMGIGANPSSLLDVEDNPRYRLIKGDICNIPLLHKTVNQVDAVVNFAAETHVDRSVSDPYTFLQNNTMGAYTVLDAVRKHNLEARMVQVSTGEVYGAAVSGAFTEKDSPSPSNPYSASKASADMFALSYHKTFGLDVSIVRCSSGFGPYQLPQKLIPKTIIRALKDLSIPVYGAGNSVRDWIYVVDCCAGVDAVLDKGEAGEIYNLSAGNAVTNVVLVKRVLELLGKPESLITFVEERVGFDAGYSLDSSKLRGMLGWQPEFSFAGALESTVKWYVENEKWWAPLATQDVLSVSPWKFNGGR